MRPIPYYIATMITSCILSASVPYMTFAQTQQSQIIQMSANTDIISTTENDTSVQAASLPESDTRHEIIGEYKAGKWNDNTYINSWADYQITLPENCQKETIASSSTHSQYDFLALIPNSGVCMRISYDDLKSKSFDVSTTEEEFGELLIEKHGTNSDISDFETVTYGDRSYTHFSIAHQDQLIQDFYLRRVSHYMMMISFTYMPVSEFHANNILDTLTYADDLE